MHVFLLEGVYVLNSGGKVGRVGFDYDVHHHWEEIICCWDSRGTGHVEGIHNGGSALSNALNFVTWALEREREIHESRPQTQLSRFVPGEHQHQTRHLEHPAKEHTYGKPGRQGAT